MVSCPVRRKRLGSGHSGPASHPGTDGAPGALYGSWDEPCVLGFTVEDGRIAALHLIADPGKLKHLRNRS